MKLTTKRNRRYFLRELFMYMVPMILIVGTVDVFYHFMQCSLHPEWSAPCRVNRIYGIMYALFLFMVIILAVISAINLRKVKKQIENNFFSSVESKYKAENFILDKKDYKIKNKKHRKNNGILEMIEKNKYEEDDNFEKGVKSNTNGVKNSKTKSLKKIFIKK